jgi:hypothetical protein
MCESVLDSIKTFFSNLKEKIKDIFNKIISKITGKNKENTNKLNEIEENIKKNPKLGLVKVQIADPNKVETEIDKQKKEYLNNKSKEKGKFKVDTKKVATAATVTVTLGAAVVLLKKGIIKLPSKVEKSKKEVSNTVDKCEQNATKTVENDSDKTTDSNTTSNNTKEDNNTNTTNNSTKNVNTNNASTNNDNTDKDTKEKVKEQQQKAAEVTQANEEAAAAEYKSISDSLVELIKQSREIKFSLKDPNISDADKEKLNKSYKQINDKKEELITASQNLYNDANPQMRSILYKRNKDIESFEPASVINKFKAVLEEIYKVRYRMTEIKFLQALQDTSEADKKRLEKEHSELAEKQEKLYDEKTDLYNRNNPEMIALNEAFRKRTVDIKREIANKYKK